MVLWTFQTQLLLQIIANRVGLIMVSRRKAHLLQWSLFGIVALVNISVFCIWIPAHLEVSPAWVHLNFIWEKVEKSVFLVVDLALNMYFLYLVRSRLISKGLTKYWRLYHFNASIVLVSVAMDLLLLGLLSLQNPYRYVSNSFQEPKSRRIPHYRASCRQTGSYVLNKDTVTYNSLLSLTQSSSILS